MATAPLRRGPATIVHKLFNAPTVEVLAEA
jgi:hypothetical protein